jgi:hypothetical protein
MYFRKIIAIILVFCLSVEMCAFNSVSKFIPFSTSQQFSNKSKNVISFPSLFKSSNPQEINTQINTYLQERKQISEKDRDILNNALIALKSLTQVSTNVIQYVVEKNAVVKQDTEEDKIRRDLVRIEFERILGEIKKKGMKKRKSEGKNKAPECFISYTWQSDMREFLREWLIPDLYFTAGVNIKVDYITLNRSQDIGAFEEQIGTIEYVCVIATPQLKKNVKEYDECKIGDSIEHPNVGFEMRMIRGRFYDKRDLSRKDRTIVICIGKRAESIPNFFIPDMCSKLSNNFKELEANPMLYYGEMIRIIGQMYGVKDIDRNSYVESLKAYERKLVIEEVKKNEENVQKWRKAKEKEKQERIKDELSDDKINKLIEDGEKRLREILIERDKKLYRFNMPDRNRRFVGRIKELQSIYEGLKGVNEGTTAIIATTGLGGIGKTQLAGEYAYRYRREYNGVAFINAENNVLYGNYLDLGKFLGINFEGIMKDEKLVIEKIKNYFFTHPNWLVVFDNVESEEQIREYIPKEGTHVIITSRRNDYNPSIYNVINLEQFSKEEARAYIKEMTGTQEEEKVIDELGEELGCLPLALSHACAYINKLKKSNKGYNVTTYLQDYREQKVNLRKHPRISDYDHMWVSKEDFRELKLSKDIFNKLCNELIEKKYINVYGEVLPEFKALSKNMQTAFKKFELDKEFDKNKRQIFTILSQAGNTVDISLSLSLKQISGDWSIPEMNQKIAIDILNFCAYLSPNDIPIKLLKECIKEKYKLNEDKAEEEIERGINLLENYSLISLRYDNGMINIHRLVQEAIRFKMKNERQGELINIITLLSQIISNNFSDISWVKKEQYINHIIAIKRNIDKPQQVNSYKKIKHVLVDLYYVGASLCLAKSLYCEGRELCKRGLEISPKNEKLINIMCDIQQNTGEERRIEDIGNANMVTKITDTLLTFDEQKINQMRKYVYFLIGLKRIAFILLDWFPVFSFYSENQENFFVWSIMYSTIYLLISYLRFKYNIDYWGANWEEIFNIGCLVIKRNNVEALRKIENFLNGLEQKQKERKLMSALLPHVIGFRIFLEIFEDYKGHNGNELIKKSLNKFEEAIKEAKKLKQNSKIRSRDFDENQSRILIAIGMCLFKIEKYNFAECFYKLALEVAETSYLKQEIHILLMILYFIKFDINKFLEEWREYRIIEINSIIYFETIARLGVLFNWTIQERKDFLSKIKYKGQELTGLMHVFHRVLIPMPYSRIISDVFSQIDIIFKLKELEYLIQVRPSYYENRNKINLEMAHDNLESIRVMKCAL